MSKITWIDHIATAAAIWEFDPSLSSHRLNPHACHQDPGLWPADHILQVASKRVWHQNSAQDPPSEQYALGNGRWYFGMILSTTSGMIHQSNTIIANIQSRPSICSLTLLMSCLALSPSSVTLDSHPKRSHGQHFGSTQRIGSMSMMFTSLSVMLTPFSTISHMRSNQVFGMQFQPLKNFKLHGRQNATPTISRPMRLPSTTA